MAGRRYFGTDGMRGRANAWPMTAEVALRLAMAVGHHFRSGKEGRHRVIIGKDTRRSNYMIENALTAGFASVGMDVYVLGPLQTPGVAMLTRTLRADVGIMITASHNPHYDNGIKLIDGDGRKLSDEVEAMIEAEMEQLAGPGLASAKDIGHVQRLDDGAARYIEFAKATFPRKLRLDGLKVVVDCANGAAYRTAPAVFWELGAEVSALGVEPNGFNINDGCGSTAPEVLRRRVLAEAADVGVALDGDADRVVLVDADGEIIDGDQILASLATRLQDRGELRGGAVVATQMSNLGLEKYLERRGLLLERTGVGDRYVIERMLALGCNLGGEQSGHVILSEYGMTGDGVISALQVLAAVAESGQPVSRICGLLDPYPQISRSVPALNGEILEEICVGEAIRAAGERLGREGRILVRKSGTEPVIRVMAEGRDAPALQEAVEEVCEAIGTAGGGSQGGCLPR